MGLLTREQLLKKEELKKKKVDFGNGDYVYVRQMTGRERDRFENSLLKEKKNRHGEITYEQATEDFRAKLAVNTLCDENGNSLLKPGDYELLSKNMSAAKLDRIAEVAQELNRITDKDKDNLVKN